LALLVVLGRAMVAISRIDPATRRQVTRDVVVEISTPTAWPGTGFLTVPGAR
jgi:hypothetical protein